MQDFPPSLWSLHKTPWRSFCIDSAALSLSFVTSVTFTHTPHTRVSSPSSANGRLMAMKTLLSFLPNSTQVQMYPHAKFLELHCWVYRCIAIASKAIAWCSQRHQGLNRETAISLRLWSRGKLARELVTHVTEKQETVRQPRDQQEPQALPSVGRLKAEGTFRAPGAGKAAARKAETVVGQESKAQAAAEKMPEVEELAAENLISSFFLSPNSPKAPSSGPSSGSPLPESGNAPAGGSPAPKEESLTNLHCCQQGLKGLTNTVFRLEA